MTRLLDGSPHRGRASHRGWALAATMAVVGVAAWASALAQTPQPKPASTVLQVMRAVFFTHANVVFAAQTKDPDAQTRDAQPSLSTNPLTGLYGGWQAIENSALALADAADLLNVPGRVCSNGSPAPVQEAAWKAAVEAVKGAAVAAATAARARSQDRVFEVSEALTEACATCHRRYRVRGNPCVAPPR